MLMEYILIFSVVLQILAAFLALRLIWITEVRAAWILMAVALLFMALGRIIDVLPFMDISVTHDIILISQWNSVIISIFMIAGVSLIAPLLFSIRRSEKALRNSERRFRTLVENVNIGIYRIAGDLRGKFTHANPATAKMLGYESYDEFMRIPASSHFATAESQKRFIEELRESGYVRNLELEFRKKDGSIIIGSVTAAAQYGKHGEVKWVNGVTEDITERKQVELKLKESEERLNRVIQGSPMPAFVIGRDHKILYWNKALEELTSIKADEVVGTSQQWRSFYRQQRPCLADLLVDNTLNAIPQWYSEKYKKSSLLDEAYEVTDYFDDIGKNGKWLRFTAAAIRDSHGELVGAMETLEDVTERKQAEENLIRVRKLDSLSMFAAGIAHDFNNLLSAMLRNIFSAKLSLADETEVYEQKLELAEKVGFQAKELAHRLIMFAKGGEPIRKLGSISQLLKDSVDVTIADANVQCKFSLPDDLWPIEMDDVQIRQVIQNLLIHAMDAMPEGGMITITAENVELSADSHLPKKEGRYVKWSLADQGKGIPEEDLKNIFDPYFATKPTGAAKGMELGLAICYAIINKHDGFITVESQPDIGSSFFIFLPASHLGNVGAMAAKESAHDKSRNILVINEDESTRYASGIVLNFLGYDSECAKDSEEAIELYKKSLEKDHPFSAVVLQLGIPGALTEQDTLNEFKKIDPCVRVILSTGHKDDPIVKIYDECGFKDIVDIPYDMENMKEVMHRVLC
jgi:two-component system, cell cycle sensor histidine kinase and response regulator CckA